MSIGIPKVPVPKNETARSFAPGSPERAGLTAKLTGAVFTQDRAALQVMKESSC
jgi:hypothetical protein